MRRKFESSLLMMAALALGGCPLGTPDVDGNPITCTVATEATDCQPGEVCDPNFGFCIAAPDAGFDAGPQDAGPSVCVINGTTFDAGAFNPASPCQTCQPATSTSVFTPLADGLSPACPQGDVCHSGSCTQGCYFPGSSPAFVPANAINSGNPCQFCDPTNPASGTGNWYKINGFPSDAGSCPSGNVCLGGACTSGCVIDGGVVDAGTFEPGAGCESCDPKSPTAWTPATGTAPPGACAAGEACDNGQCAIGCIVGGETFVPDGSIDPSGCQVCNSGTSLSSLPDNTPCYDGGTFCSNGVCVPDCLIGGSLVPDGGLDPSNACESCQPAVTALNYTPITAGVVACNSGGGNYCVAGSCESACDISNSVVSSGTIDSANSCQSCQPSTTPTAYSSVTDGTACDAGGTYCVSGSCAEECLIGGALFPNKTVDAGNPNVCCNVADSSTAWTPGFGSAITTPNTTATPGAVAIGDVTGDGIPDLVVGEANPDQIEIMKGNGDGTFALLSPAISSPTGATPIVLADFNNDGHLDIAVANNGGNSVTVLLNQTDGGFAPAPGSPYPTAGTSPSALIVADLHEPGDLILIDQEFGTIPEISVLFNQLSSRNSFTAGPTSPAGTNPTSLVAGNFMNKGNVDLAVADGTTGEVTVFANNGTGTSLTAQPAVTVHAGDALSSIATADFNLDSEADLVVSDTTSNQVFALLNADGGFTVQAGVAAASSPISLAIGDFNGDGLPDMAVAEGQSTGVNVIINQTSTAATSTVFAAAQPYSVGAKPVGLGTAALVDGGNPDLVTVNGSAKDLSVLLGNCP